MMSSPQLDKTQEEDDVRTVQNTISLFQANKINNANVWTFELIDKLCQLLANHNVFLRNFRNIGVSLDATIKIYAIRVDSVCNDVRRLGFGTASTEASQRTSKNSTIREDGEYGDEFPRKRRSKTKKVGTAVLKNVQQLNAPLAFTFLPDHLSFKLNAISGDAEASNRLFLSTLPVKNSLLILNANEKFADSAAREYVEFRSDDMYHLNDEDIKMSAELYVNLSIMPLRQPDGLAGYRMQNTPIDESDEEEGDSMDEYGELGPMPNLQIEYQFDDNVESFWDDRPTGFMANNDHMAFSNNMTMNSQDLNNNNDPIASSLKAETKKGSEYVYRDPVELDVNFWAGPSYWKNPRNRPRIANPPEASTHSRARRKHTIEKPHFVKFNDDSESSEDEDFLKITKKNLKKIRHCNTRRWAPEKVRLPTQYDIPKDLFQCYTYAPSIDTIKLHGGETSHSTENNDEDDFYPQMDAENANTIPDEFNDIDLFQYEPPEQFDISENFENAPKVVEKIPISFEKRAKVINMSRLNIATLESIDKQLTRSALNESVCELGASEDLEPGRAWYSKVYKDLLANKRKFMRNDELTPSLVIFSILNAVNKERLIISKEPNANMDFEIAQLKKLS